MFGVGVRKGEFPGKGNIFKGPESRLFFENGMGSWESWQEMREEKEAGTRK